MSREDTTGLLRRRTLLRRDRPAVAGLVIIVGLILTALLAPHLAPFPEDVAATHPAQRLQPRLIIFDEPTAGLDVSVQATILRLLQDLQSLRPWNVASAA